MRLSKIKLAGFKSFVDPTTITFSTNLTGIIGPNGCGKSNTIDAVRWVMGESSAKHLRGASMEDVIFKGSSSRAPVGKAYVELVFDNSDGSLGGQYANYAEISVRREVTRDGKSGYYLNGTKCRRRDITDIFLGTGLGPRSYAIIEQGMISRMIEAKPEEMRVYIEEAAGISKYKERRRETENRIKHSRENLSRLDDLRDEIDKQISRLERQAKTAERYRELKQDERKTKAEMLALKWKEMNSIVNNRERHLQDLQNQVEAEVAKQRAIEAQIEEERDGQVEANEKLGAVQGEWYRIGSEITRTEQSIQHHRQTRERQSQDLQQIQTAWSQATEAIEEDLERVTTLAQGLEEKSPAFAALQETEELSAQRLEAAEAAMQDWQAQWDSFNESYAQNNQIAKVESTRRDQLERTTDDLQRRLERVQEELAGLGELNMDADIARVEEQESAIAEQTEQMQERLTQVKEQQLSHREQNEQLNKQLDDLRQTSSKLSGRLASLEALQQAALGKKNAGVAKWLDVQGLAGQPRLGEKMQVQTGWELAVETVLGSHLEAVCVDGFDAVSGLLGSLGKGSLMLLDSSARDGVNTDSAGAADACSLLSKVTSELAVGSLMAGVRAVDSLPEALALRASLQDSESVITKDGIWIGSAWLRVARDQDAEGGVLSRDKDIRAAQAQLEQLQASLAEVEEQLLDGRENVKQLEAERETLQTELQQQLRHHSDLRAELSGLTMRNEQANKRRGNLQAESTELSDKIELECAAMQEVAEAFAEATLALGGSEQQRESLVSQREKLQEAVNDARHYAKRDRDAMQELAISLESMRTAKDSADRNLERMQEQLAHVKQRREELLETLEDDDSPIESLQEALENYLAQRVEAEQHVNTARAHSEELEQKLRGFEQQRMQLEQDVQEKRSVYENERLNAQENKVRCQTVKEQLDETGFGAKSLLDDLEDGAKTKDWEQKVSDMAMKISRLGPINLAAIDEFQEQSERKEYLDSQHKDLTDALTTLENAIAKIDKETRSRFKDTFEQVSKRVSEMFPKLFGGGQAYLELTDDDLLNTGVTIMARPPGKRISNIHLLSGGEKALTAVAMVFAIFELNPAPFCMLDEVDAPLDEANVGRFCQLVKEMSSRVQFIFITHNKPAMELALQLQGVTMREAGVSRIVAVDVDEAVKLVGEA